MISSLSGVHAEAAQAGSPASAARPVLIATSFYKAEALPALLVASLIACTGDLRQASARVVFFNDSPGYAPLRDALASALATVGDAFDYVLHEPPENRGFPRTMNVAIAEAVQTGCDLLLLNSDTRLVPGALTEMIRVACLDAMTGFVNPRSNNATIATLPVPHYPGSDEAGELASMQALAARLPAVSYIPTAVGFCLLVRWKILAEFGGFDEVYGAGYNEENDLVMRAARCGYRAVLANHAFVWHVGEASFAASPVGRETWEKTNRAILDRRYPEYARTTAAFYHTPETLAERLMANLLPGEDGRLDLALDFSSFRADYNGTFQAGRQLLAAAAQAWGARYRTFVICAQDVYDFHGYAEFGSPRSDPHSGRTFAAVFRMGQPYDWNAVERLVMSGTVVGLYMLDTISIDCPQLASPALHHLWQLALEQADFVITQSRATQSQLAARFRIAPHAASIMAPHSLDLADYRFDPSVQAGPAQAHGRILIVGNHFAHKYVSPTANALAATFPGREIVVLGMDASAKADGADTPDRLRPAENLRTYAAGCLAQTVIDGLYLAADVIVFPSHAEGFGFPVLVALANCKPIFVRRLPVFEELWEACGRTDNMHFYESTAELADRLQSLPAWQGGEMAGTPAHDAAWSAGIIAAGIDAALQRVDYHRVAARLRTIQTANLGGPKDRSAAPPGEAYPDAAARLIGERVQRLARRLFGLRGVLRATRGLVRGGRALRRIGRTE